MVFSGLLTSAGITQSFYTNFFNKNRGIEEKNYVAPSYFRGYEDIPHDIFGDLCLLRKGSHNMTMGAGTTSIETINSRDEWKVKANSLRALFKMTLGTPPQGINFDLSVRVENEIDHGSILERRVSYLLSPGERVSSLMLIPKNITSPCPALLTIHPTTKEGKEQTVGRGEKEKGKLTSKAYNRAYGLHLAQKGYITFSPDLLGAGERIFPGKRAFDNQPFIDANPEWSGLGKDLWDLQRAIDVMQTFTEIDSCRLGSIGHSQGAGLTCALTAIDERIKLGVANCGVWPSRVAKNPFNAARTDWYTGRPALRPFLYCGKSIPIDVHELLALSAPRAFLNIVALNDVGFDEKDEPLTRPIWENLKYNVSKIYALYNVKDKFDNIIHLEGHDFLEKWREQAYTFIDRYL